MGERGHAGDIAHAEEVALSERPAVLVDVELAGVRLQAVGLEAEAVNPRPASGRHHQHLGLARLVALPADANQARGWGAHRLHLAS